MRLQSYDKVEWEEPKESLSKVKHRLNAAKTSEIGVETQLAKELTRTSDEEYFGHTLAKFLMAEVPVVNDRQPSYFNDGPTSPKLTYVDFEMVRPPQARSQPQPPSVQTVVHRPVTTGHQESKRPRDHVQPTTVKMSWEPVVQPRLNSDQKVQLHVYDDVSLFSVRNEDDSRNNRSKVSWAELPTKTSSKNSPSSSSSSNSKKPIEGSQEVRKPFHHRKVTIIKPEKLEQGLINPFSWRKGRELILKELGPFRSLAGTKKKNDDDTQEDVTEEPTSRKEKITSTSKKTSSSSSPTKKSESVAVSSDIVQDKEVLVTPDGNRPSEKQVRRRAIKNIPEKSCADSPQRQSTPKLRHYDQASVRRYIREQRKERRKKAESEKAVQKTVKATRQQKLKDLQERQKELAKAQLTMAPNSRRTTNEIEANRNFTGPRIPETLTWIDLVTPKPNQPSDNDDDFAYKRVMQNGSTMKVRAWTKNDLRRRSRRRESSSEDERVTSSDGSTLNRSSVSENSERLAKDSHVGGSSMEANERLKLLSEAGRQTVDVLMTKMMSSGMDEREKVNGGGRAAKLELLKQQALSIQNGIDEEMKRLKHRIRSKDVPIVSSSPLSQEKAEFPGVDSKRKLTKELSSVAVADANVKSKESWELSLSEGPLSSDDGFEDAPRRTSPPRTDEILQLVLASTIFANKKQEPEPTKKTVDIQDGVTRNEGAKVVTDSGSIDRRSVTEVEKSLSKTSSRSDLDVTSELDDFPTMPDVQYSRHTPTHSSASSSVSITIPDDGIKNGGALLGLVTSPSRDTHKVRTPSDSSVDEELSEGSILSHSNLERDNGSALSVDQSVVAGVREDVERSHSDNSKTSSEDLSRLNDSFIGEETTDVSQKSNVTDTSVRNQRDVVPSSSQDEKSVIATKMSPNALRLRMSAELRYLDTVNDSLDQLTNVERIRAVSLAQQETVALAQVIQARNVEGDLKMPETFASPLSNLQVLRSQAEAAKIAAETAKTLAETNNTLVASRNNNFSVALAPSTHDTVAAAAAAAVTATLSQLQLNLRRHRDRADSFLSSLSSVATSQRSSKRGSSGSQSSSTDSERSQKGAKRRAASSADDGALESAHDSPIPEDVLSEGPISPAPSSDIREQLSRNGDISEGAADDSFTEEEEISFRMFLPSQSHLRSSRRSEEVRRTGGNSHRRTTKSPSSDDQQSKRSSSSVSSDIPLTEGGDDDDASNGSLASASRLLENVPLFSGEDSFQQFTLTMVKQYMEEEKMRNQHQKAILKLREQALVEKTKAELAWIELQKKQFRIKGQDEKMPPLYKKERGLLLRLKQETADLQRLQEVQSVASKERQEIMKKQQEQMIQLTLSTRPHESHENRDHDVTKKEERLDVHSEITAQVLQGLKKLQASKRYLTRREQKLLLRRKHVEHLLNWQKQLDNEEARVQEMEQIALGVLASSGTAAAKHTRDISSKKSSSETQNPDIQVSVSEEIVEGSSDLSSVTERVHIDRSVSTDDSFEDETKGTSATVGNESEVRSETEVFKDVTASKVSSASTQVSPRRTPSVILRSPLTPRRLRSRIRKESSGSEDSCTVSHSETTSELSDVEGRVHALKEDLRRRKIEAEKLRREHKRKNKDRLKAQEASLMKQIEAYDKFIAQTRIDLQKELEEGQSKVLVRPVIKQPKVAESKRLQKQSSIEGPRSPESVGSGIDGQHSTATSPLVTELSEHGTDTNVESKSDLIVATEASHEESIEEISQFRVTDHTPKLVDERNEEVEESERSKEKEVNVIGAEKKDGEKNYEELTTKLEPHVSEHDGTLSFKSEITEDVLSFVEEDVQESKESAARSEERLRSLVSESEGVERSRVQLAVQIADTVLESILVEELRVRREKNLSTNTCDKITDSVFQSVLNESIDICVDIYDSKYERVAATEKIETPSLGNEDASFKTDNQQSPASSVSERVSLIMAEVNDRRCSTESGCSTARRTRPQDLLVLSFPDVTSPPTDDIPSPTGSPVRGSREVTLVRRPSSPVLGEPSESKNENSVGPVPQSFEGLDDAGDDDWFEEDYGLGTAPSEAKMTTAANKTQMDDELAMQHYQIYPYQGGGYYIREIPNKPPPPYTPPGQATSSTQAATAAAAAATPPFTGIPISTADFKRLTADVFESVNYDRDEVSLLLDKAVRFVNLKRSSERIENYFTAEDYEEDIMNRSRRVYKHFLLELAEETVETIRDEERRHPRHPWLRPEWPTKPESTSVVHSDEDLSAEVKRRVLPLLFAGGGTEVGNSLVPTYGCKRKDFVDEILLQELRREEKEWVTYDEDEATVKMQLADSIFEDLIAETVRWMKQLAVVCQ